MASIVKHNFSCVARRFLSKYSTTQIRLHYGYLFLFFLTTEHTENTEILLSFFSVFRVFSGFLYLTFDDLPPMKLMANAPMRKAV